MNEEGLSERRECLIQVLNEGMRPDLPEEHQDEMAELVNTLPDLDMPGCEELIGPAEIAAKALLLDPPNIKMASKITQYIKTQIRRYRNPMLAVMRGGSPSSLVILGLGFLLYVVIPLVIMYGRRLPDLKPAFGIETSLVALVAIFGAIGSIVSIMVRIHEFANLKGVDRSVLFFTGFFKPVIGTSFALFVFAVLSSGLLPLTIDTEKSHFFFAALSFIAGFSERFAQDIVSKAEKTISGS